MSEFIEFTESDQTFELNFSEVQVATDGGFEGGYNAGIEEAKKSLTEKEITANGEYLPADGKLGFSKVVVNVADENGSYNEGYKDGSTDGYNNALEKLTEITIDKDGTYEPTGDNIGFKKVVVDKSVKPTQPLEVNVPDIIASGGYVYTFNIDNEWVLVSGGSTPTTAQQGLWLYNTVANTYEQIITSNNSYKYFYKVKDKVVISSANTSTGLYVYNCNTKKCTKRSSLGGAWQYAFTIEDTLLLSSSTATVVFDYEEEEFDELFFDNASIGWLAQMYQYGNKAVFKKAGNGSGFVFYNNTDRSLDWKINSNGTSVYMLPTAYGLIVSYKDGATSDWYIGRLNEDTDSFDSVHTGTYNVAVDTTSNKVEHDNGVIYWGTSSSYKGLYWFDYKTKKFEKVSEYGNSFTNTYSKVLDKYIFLAPNASYDGCILFDTVEKTIEKPLTTGRNHICAKADDKLVLTHLNSNYKGLYVYDITTKELVTLNTTIYQTSNSSAKAYKLKDRIIAIFSGGFYIINLNDNTYTTITGISNLNADSVEFLETASGNNLFINIGNGGTSGSNVRCYNYETDSMVSIPTSTTYGDINNKIYNVYKLDGENCYAYNTDKTKNPYTLYYDSDKKQWLIHKYYLGEI